MIYLSFNLSLLFPRTLPLLSLSSSLLFFLFFLLRSPTQLLLLLISLCFSLSQIFKLAFAVSLRFCFQKKKSHDYSFVKLFLLTEKMEKKNIITKAISRIIFLPQRSPKEPKNKFPINAPNMQIERRIPSFPRVILPGRTNR